MFYVFTKVQAGQAYIPICMYILGTYLGTTSVAAQRWSAAANKLKKEVYMSYPLDLHFVTSGPSFRFRHPTRKRHHGLRSPDPDRPRSNPPKQSHDAFDPETLLCQLRKAQSQVRQGGSVLKLLQEPERVRLSEPGAVAEASQTSGG